MRPPPGKLPPFEPQGRALQAYQAGDVDAAVQVHCADGESEVVLAAEWFRAGEAFEDWERVALETCAGTVVDLGAGAGCHALELQRRGHAVLALDTDARSVDVQRTRGVVAARVGSLGSLGDACADTVLLLQHGVGLAGDLAGLRWLLGEVRRVLRPGGALLLDGRGPDHVEAHELAAARDDDYPGVAELWMSHGPFVGAVFPWLVVDAERFGQVARRAGLTADVLHREPDGRWLARARPATTA